MPANLNLNRDSKNVFKFVVKDGGAVMASDLRLVAWTIEKLMLTGTVKWYDERKGYGFVEPDNGRECLFVCRSEASGNLFAVLRENQRVAFEIEHGPKGSQAVTVEIR